MEKVRLAIVGTGFIGDYHARAAQKLPGVEITVASSRTKKKCDEFAARYNIPTVVQRATSIAGRDDVDAVIIGTPNKYHAPYAIAMMEKNKDVLIEKPMTMNAKEGEKLIAAAKKNKRVVMSGHMWRFDSEVNYVRDMIKSGKLGNVVKTKGYGIHVNWGPAGWFADKKLAGGGALADMGVHAIDTVRFIMDDPKPKKVYAKIGTYYGKYDVDDTGVVMIDWDNGAVSVIESGWWQPHMDGPEAGTRLYCTKGYASLFPTMYKMKMGKVYGTFEPELPERVEHCDQVIYDRQMEHFVDCIRKRKTPSPGLEQGQTIVKIVDAAVQSSKTGKTVSL